MINNITTKISYYIEKYGKTDGNYLLKGGFWLSIEYTVSMITSLILVIAFANLMNPEEYGVYKFIMSGIGVVGIISLTGIGNAIIQSFSKGFKNSYRKGFILQIKWSMITILLGFGVAIYYYLNNNTLLAIGFLIAGILSPLVQNFSLYESILIAKKEFKEKSNLATIRQVINSISVILTLLITQNIFIIITVYFGSFLLVNIIFHRLNKPTNNQDIKNDENLHRYGRDLSIMKGISRLATELDKILIFHFLGATQLAIYFLAFSPVGKIGSINILLKNLSLPKLSIQNIKKIKQTLPRKIILSTLMIIPVTLIYIFLAQPFFEIIFPQYLDAVIYTKVFAFSLIPSIPITLLNQVLVAHTKTKALYISQTVSPAVKIVLFIILIPFLGIWGAILAFLLSQVANLILLIVLFKKL